MTPEKNHRPSVSVVIPCYNAEKFIAQTLGSVISQTYDDFEVLVIDDGSTDGSADIVKHLMKFEPRVQYIKQENAGVSAARNTGMQMARGHYIALLDADDFWVKENLEKKINYLETHLNIDWVYSDMFEGNAELKELKIAPQGTDANVLDRLLAWEGEVVPGPGSNLVFRKICLDAHLAFEKQLSTAADMDFCIQLAATFNGARIAEPLWIYRVLGNSMSRNIRAMEHDVRLVYQRASEKKLFKSFWFRQKCYSNQYLILAGSWWVNGNNKKRGFYFIIKSLLAYPPNIKKLIFRPRKR